MMGCFGKRTKARKARTYITRPINIHFQKEGARGAEGFF